MFGVFKKHKEEEYSPEVQAVRDRAAADLKVRKCGLLCKAKKLGQSIQSQTAGGKEKLKRQIERRNMIAEQKYERKLQLKIEAERREREGLAKKLAEKEMARKAKAVKLEKQRLLKEDLKKEQDAKKQMKKVVVAHKNQKLEKLERSGKLTIYRGALLTAKTGQRGSKVVKTVATSSKKAVKKYGSSMVRDVTKAGKITASGLGRWADSVLDDNQPKRKSTKAKKRKTAKKRRVVRNRGYY